LDETWTQVDLKLYERRIANRLEAVDLARLDDKDVPSAALEGLTLTIQIPRPSRMNWISS
jgi:hypothetical protein